MTIVIHILQRWGMILLLSVCIAHPGVAQIINFGLYTTSNITLTPSGTLNFNDKQPVIASNSNSTVTIALSDNESQFIEIVGDATRDITITVNAPMYLTLDASNKINFSCRFAYSNLGSTSANVAKGNAVQVPGGFTVITLPMLRRTSGAPPPPPTPAHGGYTAPSAKVYLFLYGSLGPVGNVNAGNYTGTINVTVNY